MKNRNTGAVPLETRPTIQIMGVGRDCNPAHFKPANF